MAYTFQAKITDKLTNGLPGTTELEDLGSRIADVEYTHAALWGPLSARITLDGTIEDAFRYADQYLGNPITIYDEGGVWQWEGLVWSVRFNAGLRQRTRSLDGYANLTRVHYRLTDFSTSPPTDLGPAAPVTASDTTGQSVYGIIEFGRSEGGMLQTTAQALANQELNTRKRLLYSPESGRLGAEADTSQPTIEIQCMGWYQTLFYQAYTAATTSTADIAAVVKAILTAKGPFVSSNQDQIATTGVTTGQ
jgi:hypothetical protein